MKKRGLLLLVVGVALMMGGCAGKKIEPEPLEPYVFDEKRSYAYNTLASFRLNSGFAVTGRNGIYDTPEGGEFVFGLNDSPPDTVDVLADSPGLALSLFRSNSLSRFGVSPGAEFGFALGLQLLNSSQTGDFMMAKNSYILSRFPKDEYTKEQVSAMVNGDIARAFHAAVKEVALPEGFTYRQPPFLATDYLKERVKELSFTPPTYEVIIDGGEGKKGPLCGEEYFFCGFSVRVPTKEDKAIIIADRYYPTHLNGGKGAWVFMGQIQQTVRNAKAKGRPDADQPSLPGFEFYKAVARHLPDTYFIYLAGSNPYNCLDIPTEKGDRGCLEKSVLIHQGEEYYFLPPGPGEAFGPEQPAHASR